MPEYAAFYHLSYKYVLFMFKSLQAGMLNSISATLAKLFYGSIQINKSHRFYTRYLPDSEPLQSLIGYSLFWREW